MTYHFWVTFSYENSRIKWILDSDPSCGYKQHPISSNDRTSLQKYLYIFIYVQQYPFFVHHIVCTQNWHVLTGNSTVFSGSPPPSGSRQIFTLLHLACSPISKVHNLYHFFGTYSKHIPIFLAIICSIYKIYINEIHRTHTKYVESCIIMRPENASVQRRVNATWNLTWVLGFASSWGISSMPSQSSMFFFPQVNVPPSLFFRSCCYWVPFLKKAPSWASCARQGCLSATIPQLAEWTEWARHAKSEKKQAQGVSVDNKF